MCHSHPWFSPLTLFPPVYFLFVFSFAFFVKFANFSLLSLFSQSYLLSRKSCPRNRQIFCLFLLLLPLRPRRPPTPTAPFLSRPYRPSSSLTPRLVSAVRARAHVSLSPWLLWVPEALAPAHFSIFVASTPLIRHSAPRPGATHSRFPSPSAHPSPSSLRTWIQGLLSVPLGTVSLPFSTSFVGHSRAQGDPNASLLQSPANFPP